MSNAFNILKKILYTPSSNVFIQLFRNFFVGIAAFVVDFTLQYVLVDICGMYYLIAQAISHVTGGLVNYLMSIIWVFDKKPQKRVYMHFIYFSIIVAVGLGINTLILWLFTSVFGWYHMYSKIIATIVVFLFNFYARKYLLFK